MSKTKRFYFPEIYQELPVIPEKTDREILEAEALKAVCACYYYDLADTIDSLSEFDLSQIISDPENLHRMNDPEELEECPEYLASRAEAIRDSNREDGINV